MFIHVNSGKVSNDVLIIFPLFSSVKEHHGFNTRVSFSDLVIRHRGRDFEYGVLILYNICHVIKSVIKVSKLLTFELVPLCLDSFPSPVLSEHPLMLPDEDSWSDAGSLVRSPSDALHE